MPYPVIVSKTADGNIGCSLIRTLSTTAASPMTRGGNSEKGKLWRNCRGNIPSFI
ncbi:hypothetical protein J42TS3_42680 [Paenibacillus vini]|uniref:Uncharacterized protein n=1 Tax=Paenibacillus vini TaxID=1476024 RepID=A0ABQ4MGW7_9BACL|nr:hypothetical protein J42TS3_42680 [Paenibacillus vini]